MSAFEVYARLVRELRFIDPKMRAGMPTRSQEQALHEYTCEGCGQHGLSLGAAKRHCDDCYVERAQAAGSRYRRKRREKQR